MKTVKARVDGLADRVKIGRERALRAKNEGRSNDAIRELKKAKALEKQLTAARAALDTLERQQDMIEESVLQRELATALKSTTTSVKNKSRGLLAFAESAVDESVEVRDDVEDVAAVFEGMASTYDTGVDDDDLIEELNALTSETVGYVADEVGGSAEQSPAVEVSQVGLFPSVPGLSAHSKPARGQEKKSLLKNDSASVGVSSV
jgi:Fic family protein